MKIFVPLLTAAALGFGLVCATGAAHSQNLVVGVNLVNEPYDLSDAEQEATLKAMKAAGVRVIRSAIPDNEKGLAYARRVYAHGMRIELTIYPVGRKAEGAAPANGPQRWVGLSTFDAALSKARFESVFSKLDAAGIELAAVEMGNEINSAAFNADFPSSGEGRALGASDLKNDPEGQQVAKGYLQYLKMLAILKDARDHSKLNRQIPIISAGLVAAFEDSQIGGGKDLVTYKGTLDFLKANGLNNLVDGYGVHIYPPAGNLGAPGIAKREDILQRLFAECGAGGKPCWVTEWGSRVGTTDDCPSPDKDRATLVREMRGHFAQFAAQGRLKAIFFFTWQGFANAPHEDRFSAFRCGELTESGRLAIAPM